MEDVEPEPKKKFTPRPKYGFGKRFEFTQPLAISNDNFHGTKKTAEKAKKEQKDHLLAI